MLRILTLQFPVRQQQRCKEGAEQAKQPKRKAEEPQNAAVVIEPAAAPLPLGDVRLGQLAL